MKLFKDYKWGVDLLGVLLFALLLLPNIVYWCIPEFTGLDGDNVLSVICYLFEALGLFAMVALMRKNAQRFAFFTLTGTFTWLFLLLYYLTWIFFFCGYGNAVVKLFMTVTLCVSLLAFQTDRRNWLAVVPTSVFALLHLLNTVLFVL